MTNPFDLALTDEPQALHRIDDDQHRLTAVTFDHPAHWQAESAVRWNFQHHRLPVRMSARTFDPLSGWTLEFFPVELFCWIEPSVGSGEEGQEAGGGAILLRPLSAADALTRFVLPRLRRDRPDAGILGIFPLPHLAQMLRVATPAGAFHEGVCVRIGYYENGRAMEEEFYGLKVAYEGVPSHGLAGTPVRYDWGFERLFAFRVPVGQMDAARERFWRIIRSVKVNPAWEQVFGQVVRQLAGRPGGSVISAPPRPPHGRPQIEDRRSADEAGEAEERGSAFLPVSWR